jgi:hypothetical protein
MSPPSPPLALPCVASDREAAIQQAHAYDKAVMDEERAFWRAVLTELLFAWRRVCDKDSDTLKRAVECTVERKARADRRVLATAISSMASRHPRVSVSAARRKLREVSSRDKARGAVTRTYGPKCRTPRRCGEPFGRPTNTIRTSSHSIVRRYMCAALLPPTSAEFAVIEKGGTPALRSTMPFCTSMAQRTASTRCETQRWLHRRCA